MQRITSVGVLSCAKMTGVLYGCMALLFIPFALLGGLASLATQQTNGAIGGAVIIVLGILAPVLYGVMGSDWVGLRFSWNPLPRLRCRKARRCGVSRVCPCAGSARPWPARC